MSHLDMFEFSGTVTQQLEKAAIEIVHILVSKSIEKYS